MLDILGLDGVGPVVGGLCILVEVVVVVGVGPLDVSDTLRCLLDGGTHAGRLLPLDKRIQLERMKGTWGEKTWARSRVQRWTLYTTLGNASGGVGPGRGWWKRGRMGVDWNRL